MTPRRRRNLIDAALAETLSAVLVLDGERRVRFFSAGMEQSTGWKADEIEGMICEPATSSQATPLELFVSAFSPSHDVLTGELATAQALLPRKDGSTVSTQVTMLPIFDANRQVSRIIVTCHSQALSGMRRVSLSQKLHAEITALRSEFRKRFSEASFIGTCPAIRRALDRAELLKSSHFGYCISGGPGTGRRHLAKLIHNSGHHGDQSFVALDCRLMVAETLLVNLRRIHRITPDHSATHQRTGTLLLVDADHCPREVQEWLLQNLEGEVQNIRLAATSSAPLIAAEDDRWLLLDFCNLFSTVQIELPSLHHRENDIPLLAQHFIEESYRSLKTSAESLSSDALGELMFYRWPGNVRELKQVITEACQNSFGVTIEVEDLPFLFRAGLDAQNQQPTPEESVQSLEEIMVRFETDVLRKTLDGCAGNKAEAARRLGMTRPKLYRRLKTLGFEENLDVDDV